jgi:hypothetical protein
MKLTTATPKRPSAIARSTPARPPGRATRGSAAATGVASKLVEVVVPRDAMVAGGRGGLTNTVNPIVEVVAGNFRAGSFDATVEVVVFGRGSGGTGTRDTRWVRGAGAATGAEKPRVLWDL